MWIGDVDWRCLLNMWWINYVFIRPDTDMELVPSLASLLEIITKFLIKARCSIWNFLFFIVWCLCYKLTKYCTREVSRVMKFLQSWESSGKAVHWEGNLCLCVALYVFYYHSTFMSGHYFLLYYSESWQTKKETLLALKSLSTWSMYLPRCLYSVLFCWWTHMCLLQIWAQF